MNAALVQYTVEGTTVFVTLNRPEKRNALSRGLIDAITAAFQRAQQEAGARCVILTGTGLAFCAGMDLGELAAALDQADENQPLIWDNAVRLSSLYDLIYRFPLPTIAMVNGVAVAGGAGLVSVCDLAVSVPDALFGYPEVRRGLVAAMVMPHLLRHVGERVARHLLLTGELIDAREAVRVGFINSVVPAHELRDHCLGLAKSLALGGPEALKRTKELLTQFSRQAMSVEEAGEASAAPRLSQECRAGLRAFFEKRPAPWSPEGH